jgi:Glycosyl hydrolase family 99
MKFLRRGTILFSILFLLTACTIGQTTSGTSSTGRTSQATPTAPATSTPTSSGIFPLFPWTPTVGPSFITPSPSARPAQSSINYNHPVLAFYYPWYTPSSWCTCHMSDLPVTQYNSSDDTTIDEQLHEAMNAGITSFISSWWGPGDITDKNFAKLLTHAATLEQSTGYHFSATIYFESNAPAFKDSASMVNALRYVISQYGSDPHFFHWRGKPVIFFWDQLGNGRTLNTWASIRSQVDPHNQTIWSAEGTDTQLLDVFDGIHLFSAAYWGIQQNNISTVDQSFRAKVDAYNQAHHTQKIWAAGVLPGYDDTRIPGRKGTYTVPRNNGATYRASWTGALSSNPDWITITSFNEWYEGSMIEPSVSYHDLYLNITQQFAKRWHG